MYRVINVLFKGGNFMRYFDKKEELKARAELWAYEVDLYHGEHVQEAIKHTIIYEDGTHPTPITRKYDTNIMVIDKTTTQAIYWYKELGKLAALNFASYKNPGGRFLEGSSAQEECLCHDSILYNVLSSFIEDFYKPNLKRLNNALYQSNLIYTPNVLFDDGKFGMTYCDIITCAAPNRTAAKRYKNISDETINSHMVDRIDHVLFAAYDNNVETLILGAFGCGVFGNDPHTVASIFKKLLTTKYEGCFETVIFAIPSGENYDKFKEVFYNEL